MSYYDKTVTITEVDNGYLVEWSDPSRKEKTNYGGISFPEKHVKTDGKEIFTSKDKALKRAKELL